MKPHQQEGRTERASLYSVPLDIHREPLDDAGFLKTHHAIFHGGPRRTDTLGHIAHGATRILLEQAEDLTVDLGDPHATLATTGCSLFLGRESHLLAPGILAAFHHF
jgi:hypothetical protein